MVMPARTIAPPGPYLVRHSAVRKAWLVVTYPDGDVSSEVVWGEYDDRYESSQKAARRFAVMLNDDWQRTTGAPR